MAALRLNYVIRQQPSDVSHAAKHATAFEPENRGKVKYSKPRREHSKLYLG